MGALTTMRAAFQGWNLSWSGLRRNTQGEWWLMGQMALILATILCPSWPQTSAALMEPTQKQALLLAGIVVLAIGLVLAASAFLALGDNLSPLPDPKPGIQIVRQGPYQLCRHPMYLAVLVCAAGVLLIRQSALQLVLLLALGVVLRGKAQREERGLTAQHPDYSEVMGQTPAIAAWLPGLNWPLPSAAQSQR